MEVLLSIKNGLIRNQLPDDQSLFLNQAVITVEGNQYFYADYVGTKNISSDYDVTKYKSTLLPEKTDISILNVSPVLPDFDDSDKSFTVKEGLDIIATGAVSIPDQNFRVPFKRVDTGRIQLMVANVVNGEFKMTMNFKTGGKWVVNSELVNSELPKEMFSIEDHIFYVV